ncbi:MAG: hypothetical protein JST55_04545 [Bacteroidetes bacterium]|nr:hypothetical protein [Bacteroidota bacterium]
MTEKYNTPFEKVEVINHMANGKINIKRIKWKNTVYKVTEVISEFLIREGDNPSMNYTLKTDQDVILQLKFDKINMTWELIKWDYDST